jgi:HSP20 family protein
MPSDDWWDEEDPFEKIFREMLKKFEDIFKDIDKLEPGKPFVRGFSLSIGPDGKPVFREFGGKDITIKPDEEKEELRADIIDQGDKYLFVTDLPGVDKDSINLEITDNKLIVKASGKKKYYEVFRLPNDATSEIIDFNYNNGILTVEIKKRRGWRKILPID